MESLVNDILNNVVEFIQPAEFLALGLTSLRMSELVYKKPKCYGKLKTNNNLLNLQFRASQTCAYCIRQVAQFVKDVPICNGCLGSKCHLFTDHHTHNSNKSKLSAVWCRYEGPSMRLSPYLRFEDTVEHKRVINGFYKLEHSMKSYVKHFDESLAVAISCSRYDIVMKILKNRNVTMRNYSKVVKISVVEKKYKFIRALVHSSIELTLNEVVDKVFALISDIRRNFEEFESVLEPHFKTYELCKRLRDYGRRVVNDPFEHMQNVKGIWKLYDNSFYKRSYYFGFLFSSRDMASKMISFVKEELFTKTKNNYNYYIRNRMLGITRMRNYIVLMNIVAFEQQPHIIDKILTLEQKLDEIIYEILKDIESVVKDYVHREGEDDKVYKVDCDKLRNFPAFKALYKEVISTLRIDLSSKNPISYHRLDTRTNLPTLYDYIADRTSYETRYSNQVTPDIMDELLKILG